MKKNLAQKGFAQIFAIAIIVILVFGTIFVLQKSSTKKSGILTTSRNFLQKVGIPITSPTPTTRSKAPGVITNAVTAKSIDAKTGAAVDVTNIFLKTDPNISLVLSVKNPSLGTKFEYVRYLNGKYLDNRSLATTKAGVTYVSFNWKLKTTTSTHPVGTYLVKVYTQGVFEREVSYTVK